MELRLLTTEDSVQHEKLANIAFVTDYSPEDTSLPSGLMPGIFDDDGKLCADMEIIPRKCHFNGSFLSCAAVGGVASLPENSGKGYVKRLFDFLYDDLSRDCNFDISILYPFSEQYYRKLGFSPLGKKMNAVIPFSSISSIPKYTNAELFERENKEDLNIIYNAFSERYNLSFLRDTNCVYFSSFSENRYTYIIKDEKNRTEAFFSVTKNRDKRFICITEFYYRNYSALIHSLGFIKCFGNNYSDIHFESLPEDSPVFSLADEHRFCSFSLSSVGAVRIINAKNVLAKIKSQTEIPSFSIKITDTLPQNNICIKLFPSDNGTVIEETNSAADAETDIYALSKLVFDGAEKSDDLTLIPGLKINSKSDFISSFFKKGKVYFTDPF